MTDDLSRAIARANHARYRPGMRAGHYESYFQRANHPTRPLAFWIRYTVFAPRGRPDDAIGELWAVYFDGETGRHVVVKREVPAARCRFAPSDFAVAVDDARLDGAALAGAVVDRGHAIRWDLRYAGTERPLFFLPLRLYDTPLPRAKVLVGVPRATYAGALEVDGTSVDVTGWVGSQNHNWGSRHTDRYAWGQVMGFDDAPESSLEIATARLKFGPVWSPAMTPMVLRHAGREHALNSLVQTVRATGTYEYFEWRFASATRDVEIDGTIRAPREAFVGLVYGNPPGGAKQCLNSKLASCELRVRDRRAMRTEVLACRHRAAFEILTDETDHGVEMRA
jgi:hypothetical protein